MITGHITCYRQVIKDCRLKGVNFKAATSCSYGCVEVTTNTLRAILLCGVFSGIEQSPKRPARLADGAEGEGTGGAGQAGDK